MGRNTSASVTVTVTVTVFFSYSYSIVYVKMPTYILLLSEVCCGYENL